MPTALPINRSFNGFEKGGFRLGFWFSRLRGVGPVSGFRDMPCGNIGPWPDHCGSRRKEGRAFRVSFLAEDVFHRFIAVAPSKIHSGLLQPRPESGGMLKPGGPGPRPERSILP